MKAIKKKVVRGTGKKENAKKAIPAKPPAQLQNLLPTPAEAWGSALREYNAPKLSGRRWLAEASSADTPAELASPCDRNSASLLDDPNFDWDQVVLDGWSFSYNSSRPLQLTGRVFNDCGGFEEGDVLEYTSQIVSANGRVAVTKSGSESPGEKAEPANNRSLGRPFFAHAGLGPPHPRVTAKYFLGKPDHSFGPIRLQLLRQGWWPHSNSHPATHRDARTSAPQWDPRQLPLTAKRPQQPISRESS